MRRHSTRIRKANPVRLSHVINTVVNNLCIGQEIGFEKLRKNWQEIMGTANAKNTHPVSLKDGILTITVSSPAWITQTRFYKSSFIEKINGYLSHDEVSIKDIHFTLL